MKPTAKAPSFSLALLLAVGSSPAWSQAEPGTNNFSNQFMECVNKASANHTGRDLGGRYDAVKRCQDIIQMQPEANSEIFEAKQKKIVDAQAETDRKIFALLSRGEQVIKSQLKDPSSAIVEWSGSFIEMTFKPDLFTKQRLGLGACGFINAKNGFGGYTGPKIFIVIFENIDGALKYSRIGTDSPFDITTLTCARTVFPPLPVARKSEFNNGKPDGLAGELQALADLYKSGALTAEEYAQAKARLLGK